MSPWNAPSHSEAAPPRKPHRRGLWIPWGLAAALAVGWSLAWVWMMGETQARFDAAAAGLRAHGWHVSWRQRHVGGYPFRLDVDLSDLTLTDPSGWGLRTPMLKTEAYAFAQTWVFFAPNGLVVTRPQGGAVNVTGSALRGSVSGWDHSPPDIALEGDDLTLMPAAGAAPVDLTAIRKLQAYTRPGPDDQGAAYLQIDAGQPAPGGWLAQLGAPVDFKADITFNHAIAFQTPSWRAALTNWAHAGGSVQLGHLDLTAGAQSFTGKAGNLTVADTGFVVGQLQVSGGPAAHPQDLALQFHDGGAWLGPVKLQPAPKLF